MSKVIVKFRSNFRSYFAGDLAGFDEDMAERLVKSGCAVYADSAKAQAKANREVINAVLREPTPKESAQDVPEETPWKDLMTRAKKIADAKGLKLPQKRGSEDLQAFIEEHG